MGEAGGEEASSGQEMLERLHAGIVSGVRQIGGCVGGGGMGGLRKGGWDVRRKQFLSVAIEGMTLGRREQIAHDSEVDPV